MTTTVDLANMPTAGTDEVVVQLLDQTKLKPRGIENLSGGGRRCAYSYADGDPSTPTTIIVTQTYDTKNGIIGTSVKLETVQTVTVDSIVTEVAPVNVTIAFNTPGPMEDSAGVLNMIGTAYSLLFDALVSKVPQTGIIDAMNFALIADLY
jgi:hypothetical protein